MDTALSPPVGQLLGGRYHVGSLIARGGMASVYLGTDTRLDRVVAIKIAHPDLSEDAEFVRRFIGEARSAARLSSPNVVAIYDQGSDHGLHFIAMEYVPGRTLRQVLNERGRIGEREALDIISGILTGLSAAHEAGLAHRDVKPENVLLTPAGVVKVADFGLARAVSGAVQTRSGMIIGTAAYLAPEQVTGGMPDARTDVYAAGVVLYEMLTGTQPHVGESPLAVAYKHVHDVVPAPSSVLPGLSPALDALVTMATSRDPDLRPADAEQFLRAIDDVRNGTVPYLGGYGYPGTQDDYHYQYDRGDAGQDGWYGQDYGPADPWDQGYQGAVGASALPSLSPQSAELAAPPAAVVGPVQHTLVVSTDGPTDYGYPGGPGRAAGRPRREPVLQRLLFSRRLLYLTGTLALVAVIAVAGWWLMAGRYTAVPSLRGLAVGPAQAELRGAGLTARVGATRHSALPKGEIIATSPGSGARIGSGSAVTLIVSLGPQMIQVPNVSGESLQAAEANLRAAHLSIGAITKMPSTVQAGDVIATTPPAYSTTPQTRPIRITISAGPPLPDFVGQQVQSARAVAQAGGYTINAVPDASGSQPANTITSQSPAPGTPITPGEVVTVHFSPGPPGVPVPDVRGMSIKQAIRALRRAGFLWTIIQQGPGNTVGRYSPGGTQPKGSLITLDVGFFSGF
jgi:beta-lactam-binding protein with PASTA domain/tRNA A-37 threonylcarbamoyl transferase component Bud32